jgi:predicted ester cyclase
VSEKNKAIVRRLLEEVWGAGTLEAVDELVHHSEYRSHIDEAFPPGMEHALGPRIVTTEVQIYRSAFPDLAVQVEEIVAEGDLVAVLWGVGGTNTGELRVPPSDEPSEDDVAATDKELTTSATTLFTVTGGKITAASYTWSPIGLLKQVRLFDRGVMTLALGTTLVSVVVPPEG